MSTGLHAVSIRVRLIALGVLVLSTPLYRKRMVDSKPESNMANDERQGAATPQPDEVVPS